MSSAPRQRLPLHVLVVYSAALLQGLAVVAFPASSTVLRAMHNLSDEGYGSLFLPQTILTIVGSLLGGALAQKFGLRALLVASAIASALSQVALLSVVVLSSSLVLPILLIGTGLMGLGFGVAAAPLNTYPGLLFAQQRDSALIALHTALGAGFSLGPILVSSLVAADVWVIFPSLVATSSLLIALLAARVTLPQSLRFEAPADRMPGDRSTLALFAAIAVLYAFAEGTFSNWASIYLHDARGVGESLAALAISGFWAALTLGRLIVATLVTRVGPQRVWISLPLGMAAIFLLLPYVTGAISGLLLFVLAGFACSAFFPLTVAIASKRFPDQGATVASLLTAALMIGVGGGSFALGALRSIASFESIYRLSAAYPLTAIVLGLLFLGEDKRAPVRRIESR